MSGPVYEKLLLAGDQGTGTLRAVQPLILLVGKETERGQIDPVIRPHQLLDRIVGLARIGRSDVEDKFSVHQAGGGIQIDIIVRDLRQDQLEQLPVPFLLFLLFPPFFLVPFPEGIQAIFRDFFALSGGGIEQELQDPFIRPGLFVFVLVTKVFCRRLTHLLYTVQDEFRVGQKEAPHVYDRLQELLLLLIFKPRDIFPHSC